MFRKLSVMHPFVVPGVRNNANQWIMIPFYSLPPIFQEQTPERSCCQSRNSIDWSDWDTNKRDSFPQPKGIPSLCKKRVENAMTIKIGNSFAHMPLRKAFTALHPRYANAT
jgi:hypothetical protein